FLHYYGWPSMRTFFWTDIDVFGVYNEGRSRVDKTAKEWFHYPQTQIWACSPTIQGKLLAPMPMIYLLLNLAFVISALLFLAHKTLRENDPILTGSFRLAAAFLLTNAFFSIFASPSVFRYQILPMILLFVFGVCAFFRKLDVKSTSDARP